MMKKKTKKKPAKLPAKRNSRGKAKLKAKAASRARRGGMEAEPAEVEAEENSREHRIP